MQLRIIQYYGSFKISFQQVQIQHFLVDQQAVQSSCITKYRLEFQIPECFGDRNKFTDQYILPGIDQVEPEGQVKLRYEFEPTGKPEPRKGKGAPGRAQLYINEKLVGNVEFPTTVPLLFGIEGLSCGYDFGEAVTHEYHAPFTFTGKIHKVTVDLSGDLIQDDEATMRRLISQQ